jgi:hypothetical protein
VRRSALDTTCSIFLQNLLYSNIENLILSAKSEMMGSALLDKEFLNPKQEIRKPKQYRMAKNKTIQTKDITGIAM